jgi:hypothetical protein
MLKDHNGDSHRGKEIMLLSEITWWKWMDRRRMPFNFHGNHCRTERGIGGGAFAPTFSLIFSLLGSGLFA